MVSQVIQNIYKVSEKLIILYDDSTITSKPSVKLTDLVLFLYLYCYRDKFCQRFPVYQPGR